MASKLRLIFELTCHMSDRYNSGEDTGFWKVGGGGGGSPGNY